MTKKNRYAKRSRISEAKFRQLVKLSCLDLTATQIAAISHLNINTVDKYLFGIRQRIAEYCEKESPFKGAVEVDESFFGARRVWKTIVFGIFKRNGAVYTEIVPDCYRRNNLAALYPEDKATGFKIGDIRGAFTIIQK